MGECANESIGLNIKGIKIMDKVTGEELSQGSMTFNASETNAKGNAQSSKFTAGLSVGGGQNKGERAKTQ